MPAVEDPYPIAGVQGAAKIFAMLAMFAKCLLSVLALTLGGAAAARPKERPEKLPHLLSPTTQAPGQLTLRLI